MRLRSTQSSTAEITTEEAIVRSEFVPLGTLLVYSGVINDTQLQQIIARQKETGLLFGESALELGFVTEQDIRRAVAEQQRFSMFSEGDSRLDPVVVAAFNPADPLSEAARDIRRTIATSKKDDGQRIRSLAMLSIGAPTETSVLTANLAVCFAQAGYRALLVDANLDAPLMHRLFRLPNRTGVSALLSRGNLVGEYFQASPMPNLTVITAGPEVPNSPELFDKVRIFRRLAAVVDQFDIVLVDAGSSQADEVAIFDGADAAMILVRKHASSTVSFKQMADRLDAVGVGTLGSIFVE